MKLSQSQRHTAYTIMLAEAEENLEAHMHGGFCEMSSSLFGIHPVKTGLPLVGLEVQEVEWKDCFPELWVKRPDMNVSDGYWFEKDVEGWGNRIELLKKCIEETA